jgi:hypothetical protein
MNVTERFNAACIELAEPELAAVELLPVLLARACAQALGVAGAGISVFADDFRVPLGASDLDAGTAERLQFTLGEGPCLDAYRHSEPFRGDETRLQGRWPIFYGELVSRTPFRSVISFPLRLSQSIGGAVDLYQFQADDVDAIASDDLLMLRGRIVAALNWQPATQEADVPGPGWLHGPTAQRRTRTWIAIGMLNSEFQLNSPDALARLRGYAYANDQALEDVAESLVRRTLPLEALQL